jgi:predicted DNA-binding protein (MmcQ/YjbR family)
MPSLAADPRLKRVLALGAQLPETTQVVEHNHAQLRVRGKVFAYFLANHDNDGITSLCVRSANGENTDRAQREPERFYLPPYIGKRGWFGLRLDRGRVDWDEVANLLELSYCLAAPKKLAAQVQSPAPPTHNKQAEISATSAKTVKVTILQDSTMCAIPVPFDPKLVFGKVRAPVKVTLNGYTWRSTIAPMGGAHGYLIPLRKSNREAAGVSGGDTLNVTIELDTGKREITVPPDLLAALKRKPQAWTRWQQLSYTHRREHAEALTGAKKAETRTRRLAKILQDLGK